MMAQIFHVKELIVISYLYATLDEIPGDGVRRGVKKGIVLQPNLLSCVLTQFKID